MVCLTGPRQAGKSTLLKHIQEPNWEYLNFDQRGLLERALHDPDLFIQNTKTPAILDEVQKAPPLFHAIKAIIDDNPEKKFILSGSANFQLMQNITETLAGRTALLELFPFSIGEISGITQPVFLFQLLKTKNFADFLKMSHDIKPKALNHLYGHILSGGMPKICELKTAEEKTLWFENYRTTYIERDLRNLAQIGNLEDFQKFYQSLAFQTGNILNLSDLAKDIGVTVPTCKRYLDILRTSYQAFTLPAYHTNIKKRLVKSPKCYLMDTGMACFFLRYESEEMLKNSGRLGALFETWVINEIQKICATFLSPPAFYFWQPHAGHEIDLLLEYGEFLYAIEIKHAVRIQNSDIKGMQTFFKDIRHKKIPFGIILYRGDKIQTVAPNIAAIPLEYLWH
ncbi:MAG: ATP-binding protein [Deltaproteobacteria bacterium]|nr:ATP-binding protein [Deltaproteobacteria bacterium]